MKNIPDCKRFDLLKLEVSQHCSRKTLAFDRAPLSNNFSKPQPALPLALLATEELPGAAGTPWKSPQEAQREQQKTTVRQSRLWMDSRENVLSALTTSRILLSADQKVFRSCYLEPLFPMKWKKVNLSEKKLCFLATILYLTVFWWYIRPLTHGSPSYPGAH